MHGAVFAKAQLIDLPDLTSRAKGLYDGLVDEGHDERWTYGSLIPHTTLSGNQEACL